MNNCHRRAHEDKEGKVAEFVDPNSYKTCGSFLCDSCCVIVNLRNEKKKLKERNDFLQSRMDKLHDILEGYCD